MKNWRSISLLLLMLLGGNAYGQKQLIVLQKEDVLLRLYPGDEFIFKLKGERRIRTTYVNNIFDAAVLTHRDTIPFHKIDRIYFPQRRFYNTIGTALVIFGGGLFLIDQFNTVVVNGQSPDLDDNVTALTLSSLGVGLPLMLIRKKSQKIRYPTRLMLVEQGSGFYRPDTRQQIN